MEAISEVLQDLRLMRNLLSDGGSAGTREMENGAYGALPCPPAGWLGPHPIRPLTLLEFTSPLIIKSLKNLLSAAAPISCVLGCWGGDPTKSGILGARFPHPQHPPPPPRGCRNSGVLKPTPRSLEQVISDHGELEILGGEDSHPKGSSGFNVPPLSPTAPHPRPL